MADPGVVCTFFCDGIFTAIEIWGARRDVLSVAKIKGFISESKTNDSSSLSSVMSTGIMFSGSFMVGFSPQHGHLFAETSAPFTGDLKGLTQVLQGE